MTFIDADRGTSVIRGVVAATLVLAGLLGGCQSTPSRSPLDVSPSVASSSSADEVSPSPSQTLLATPIPGSLSRIVNVVFGTLSPLTAEQFPLVEIDADAAANTVFTYERDTGWPDFDIAWKDGGCVLLAWYERHPMSRAPYPPPPSAVYVVRLVDELDPSREIWVMVEATTGQLGGAFGGPSISDCAAVAS